MNYATIKTHDIANGPGVRVSLYVSGCTHHCDGCFNAETWDFAYGEPFDEAVEQQIMDALSPSFIKGFSLLGGEPFEPANTKVLAPLVRKIRETYPDKTIWCYSGYLMDEDLLSGRLGNGDEARAMLECIDVLIDGEFHLAEKVIDLRFRGSTNQRLIDVQKTLAEGKIIEWQDPSVYANMEL